MTETVKTDAFSMRFFRFGTGAKAFVILPGLSVQSVMDAEEAVKAAYADFAEDYTVYVFDRRSELPPEYSVRDMARDTAEAMRCLGVRDTFLFGASQGGMIAQVLAAEYPELVRKLVLGSTSARLTDEAEAVVDRWIALAEAKDAVGLYLDFGRQIYPPEVYAQSRDLLVSAGQSVTDADLERFRILAAGMKGFNMVDELEKIRCPVLVIGVYEDQVLESDMTMEIAEKLDRRPKDGVYLYKGYGHAAFDTAPDYKDRIARFFSE